MASMIKTFLHKLKLAVQDPSIRNRLLFVLGMLLVFRALAVIPIPGIDVVALEEFFNNNQFLGLLNIFSGGGLANLSIVMLGLSPYITASIIMQLLTIMSPKLKALYSEEGEIGRKKFAMYSRWLAVPLALTQGFGFLVLLTRQGIVANADILTFIVNVLVISAGSLLLMWLGELITEFGIGNGVSLLIFAGIVASLPTTVNQLLFSFDVSQLPLYLGFSLAAIIITYAVVVITEAERPIPITYAKQARSGQISGGVSTYLPIRLNQAGVIPIIFALSMLLLPQMLFNFAQSVGITWINNVGTAVTEFLANQWVYAGIYFVLVFIFTYFYTAVTFDPDQIAKNLQKSGAFVPGVRPGVSTSEYIGDILTRLTLVSALFLGLIAVLPLAMQAATGITAFAIGGTSLLIAVSVVLDLIRKVEAQLSIREY